MALGNSQRHGSLCDAAPCTDIEYSPGNRSSADLRRNERRRHRQNGTYVKSGHTRLTRDPQRGVLSVVPAPAGYRPIKARGPNFWGTPNALRGGHVLSVLTLGASKYLSVAGLSKTPQQPARARSGKLSWSKSALSPRCMRPSPCCCRSAGVSLAADSFKPVIQRSLRPIPELPFEAAVSMQARKVAGARPRNECAVPRDVPLAGRHLLSAYSARSENRKEMMSRGSRNHDQK